VVAQPVHRQVALELFVPVFAFPACGVLIDGDEIANGKRITLEEFRERNRWRRLVNRLAWSLRGWL
jgi:hypothetical protein